MRFAGHELTAPRLMGVVNVTPDSFSDGGCFLDPDAAIKHGRRLMAAGAVFLDVGGESTRPGAQEVSADEECARILPVIRALAQEGAKISVDTRHAATMADALAAGAAIINDISALAHDPESLPLAAASQASVVLMHMQGTPADMQSAPHYQDAVAEVADYLAGRVAACVAAGIGRERIAIDPGIGFGKTDPHNLALLAALPRLAALGCAVLVGVSRKSLIARLSSGEDAQHRLPGSLALTLYAAERGAHILRVHDVAETAQALKLWQAARGAEN